DVTKDWMGVASGDTYIAHVDARNEANAQLIASAPLLYEALKEVRRYAVDVASFNSIDSQVIAGMCYVALSRAKVKDECNKKHNVPQTTTLWKY
ncbi:hypothetical protein LCGC14_2896340, partial [marine sediment metagenome]